MKLSMKQRIAIRRFRAEKGNRRHTADQSLATAKGVLIGWMTLKGLLERTLHIID